MRYFLFFTLLGLLSVIYSCDEGFSTTVDSGNLDFEKQLVFTVFPEQNDTELFMYVGTNFGILEDVSNSEFGLESAKVTMTNLVTQESYNTDDDGTFLETSPAFNYLLQNLSPNFFQGGVEYEFVVEHQDFETSSTSLLYPQQGKIENVQYKFEDGINEEGEEASSVTFDIIDEPGVANFYELELRVETESSSGSFSSNFFIFSPDPAVSRGIEADIILISDESFDGESKRLLVKFNRNAFDPDNNEKTLLLNLCAINEGFYLYSRSLERASFGNDNPFGSPVQVVSNVNNALGVIGFRNQLTVIID